MKTEPKPPPQYRTSYRSLSHLDRQLGSETRISQHPNRPEMLGTVDQGTDHRKLQSDLARTKKDYLLAQTKLSASSYWVIARFRNPGERRACFASPQLLVAIGCSETNPCSSPALEGILPLSISVPSFSPCAICPIYRPKNEYRKPCRSGKLPAGICHACVSRQRSLVSGFCSCLKFNI